MSTVAKRKAQDLVRHGKVQDAIEKMRDLVSEGESDPYDHVYLGDLLMRIGEREDALSAYQQAIRSYEAVGLNRNAIAIAKKVVRIDGARPEVHRSLAQLYESEGLSTEALPHYLTYLDSFSGESIPPNEFLETLDKAAGLTGTRVEVALRLVEHFQRVRRHQRAAELLEEVADNAVQAGSEDIAVELRQRAAEARQSAQAGGEPRNGDNAGAFEAPPRAEPVQLPSCGQKAEPALPAVPMPREELSGLPPEDDSAARESRAGNGSEVLESMPRDSSSTGDTRALETPSADPSAPEEAASEPVPFRLDREAIEDALGVGEAATRHATEEPAERPPETSDSGAFHVEHFPVAAPRTNASGAEAGSSDHDSPPLDDRESFPHESQALPPGSRDGEDQVWEIEEATPSSPLSLFPELSSDDPQAEAAEAYAAGKWGQARALYEAVHHGRPADRHILARLVEVIRHLHDHPGEVHYLSLLGDAWIAEDEYEEALECFLRILQLDPGNGAAQRRLAKFHELGVKGAEAIRESDSNALPGILDAGRTEVAVKASEAFRTEDWVELEGLLEEFKSGLKNQMDESDYQAHYDLAVSHHSMGLVDEALEEVDVALACEQLPAEVERRARELRGSCLMELQRFREAVHEYREAAERAGDDRSGRRAALYNLGRALEAVEEWQEAFETYTRLKVEAPGLLDVEKRLRHCENQISKVDASPSGRDDADRSRSARGASEADDAAA